MSLATASRNARLYPLYAALFNALFWMPVFFLFFSAHLPLDRVLQLEAIYYAAVVLLEVPSGYFSDSVGRRATLLVAAGALVGAYALFVVAETFAVFVAAQVLLAAGIAFNSGTDTAFHFDSLAEVGLEDEYDDREAVVARNAFAASALAAVGGGLAGTFQLRAAYALSLGAALIMLVVVFLFREPVHARPVTRGMVGQLADVIGDLRRPALAWLFGFAVLMTVLNHVPYELYQPYLDLLVAQGAALPLPETPLMAGLHLAGTMAVASWFAGRSIDLRDRVGTAPALLVATALQLAVIGAMAVALHVVVALLVLLRSVPRGLMTAPLNAAVTPRVAGERRATYLSVQSLVGRLSFSATLLGLSALVPGVATADWPALSRMATASLALGLVGLALLALTVPRVLRETDE